MTEFNEYGEIVKTDVAPTVTIENGTVASNVPTGIRENATPTVQLTPEGEIAVQPGETVPGVLTETARPESLTMEKVRKVGGAMDAYQGLMDVLRTGQFAGEPASEGALGIVIRAIPEALSRIIDEKKQSSLQGQGRPIPENPAAIQRREAIPPTPAPIKQVA